MSQSSHSFRKFYLAFAFLTLAVAIVSAGEAQDIGFKAKVDGTEQR